MFRNRTALVMSISPHDGFSLVKSHRHKEKYGGQQVQPQEACTEIKTKKTVLAGLPGYQTRRTGKTHPESARQHS